MTPPVRAAAPAALRGTSRDSRALDSVREAEARAAGLARALAALDNLDLVGDADYAAAHRSLQESGIDVTRVRDAILKLGLTKDKALPLLAAFGPLLNAPVLVDLTATDAALATLQAGDHDVPIVLLEPLLEALKSDLLLETPSAAALLFLAGAKSRRVRAIVDPQALEEERRDLQRRHKEQMDTAGEAREVAATLSPHTDEYRLALRAQEAVKLHSLEKADAARAELAALDPKITVARKLTTAEALRSIEDAVRYLTAGGEAALAQLANEIADLVAAFDKVEVRLFEIAPLLTQDAMVAHDGARKFILGGGQDRLKHLQSGQASLTTV